MKDNQRYIFDSLYGKIYFEPYVWEIITCPELQRLREVRLCNINSLSLTGASNINRYEHSVGTCYLAQECIKERAKSEYISEDERQNFVLAALLHDVGNGPFGHSLEYQDSKLGFSPEEGFFKMITGEGDGSYKYKVTTLEPIYFGRPREVAYKLKKERLKDIAEIIKGKGKYGCLINGVMDLDNIDNVYRMAYHMGLINNTNTPLALARLIWSDDGSFIADKRAIPLIEEWYNVRKRLYEMLLLNPDEFSGKCMLTEVIGLAQIKDSTSVNWRDTDFELVQKLVRIPDVKVNVKDFLFSINNSSGKVISDSKITTELTEVFEKNKVRLNKKCVISKEGNDFVLINNSTRYIIEEKECLLEVYKTVSKNYEIQETVTRLMTGNVYGCIGIFSTTNTSSYDGLNDTNIRIQIEHDLSKKVKKSIKKLSSAMIALHPILDRNKTERQVKISIHGEGQIEIGNKSNQLLIGVFLRNVDYNMINILSLDKNTKMKLINEVKTFLSNMLNDNNIKEIKLFSEVN